MIYGHQINYDNGCNTNLDASAGSNCDCDIFKFGSVNIKRAGKNEPRKTVYDISRPLIMPWSRPSLRIPFLL